MRASPKMAHSPVRPIWSEDDNPIGTLARAAALTRGQFESAQRPCIVIVLGRADLRLATGDNGNKTSSK